MTPVAAAKKLSKFDPRTFLSTINGGRKIAAFLKKQTIFAQGDPSDAVFYIKEGKVKLTIVSKAGKEATIGVLNKGDFFGEGCLTGQPLRLSSATAMTDCSVMKIDKQSMIDVLHREHAFSDLFVAYLLTRNIRYEEDLVDQLFNSSEKRLARILLLLAHFGKDGKPETVIPKISQESLAEMVGTTRSRVSFFMNRFRKLGLIDYHAGDALQVHSSLLNIVLHDQILIPKNVTTLSRLRGIIRHVPNKRTSEQLRRDSDALIASAARLIERSKALRVQAVELQKQSRKLFARSEGNVPKQSRKA